MAELEQVTDHTEQALQLLIDAYQGLPRLSGFITSITNRLQEFEDINWDVANKRLLDYTDRDGNPAHAIGAQLDTIGRIVGRGRNGQDDDTYLVYIRAQIFLNRSTGLRGDLVTLLQLIESSAFDYSEFYPCTVLVQFTDGPVTSPLILLDIAKRAVNGGVRLLMYAPVSGAVAANMFTCSHYGDPTVPTLGFGTYGSTTYGAILAAAYA